MNRSFQAGPESGVHDERPFAYRYSFADAEFDEIAMALRVAGRTVPVEPLPLGVLSELVRRPNEAVTRNELLDKVWSEPTIDHALTSAVNKLRKALGQIAAARIESVPRVGYRLVGPVERVAVGRSGSAPSALQAGQPVPWRAQFHLDKLLSERPNSSVWQAVNPASAERRVYKFATDGEGLASLKRESTVCRMLQRGLGERPDFVRLLERNFAHAPFFLEYEYGGLDLPAWAQASGRLQTMTIAQRVDLFLQIARAVAAAHGLGVLHKDLKPANVLVAETDGGLQVRLTDFGNSRLLDPTRLAALGVTALGLTITQGPNTDGTPLYLAPELLLGQSPSVASDVYALGLILYQLIAGDFRRPMSTGWQRDVGDELLIEDLTAATEGQPQARLSSVAEMVQRLAGLEARRAERAETARKAQAAAQAAESLRRSRARRPWLTAVFASLAVGLAGSVWFQLQALEALDQAVQESARAQAMTDFMNKDVLQSADVLRASSSKPVTMFEILQRASERAGSRFSGQPRTEASVRRQLGDIYLRMQYLAQAEIQFTRAIKLLEGMVAPNDPELLAMQFALAQTSVGLFRPAEALQRLQEAEQAAGAQVLEASTELARRAARARADVLLDAQRPQEALSAALRAVALSDALTSSEDIGPRFEARQRLGEVYLRLGDKTRAEALFAELARPPYQGADVGEVLLARARLRAGRERINDGRLDEAETILTGVRDSMARAFGPNELYGGGANFELIDVHTTRGDFARAEEAARAAVLAFTTALGPQHNYTLNAEASLGAVELERGDVVAALQRFENLRPRAQSDKNAGPLLAAIDFGRAKAMSRSGQAEESLRILSTVAADMLAESSWGPRDFQWQLLAEKAYALLALGRRGEAADMLRTALAEMHKAGSHPWMIERYRNLLREAKHETSPPGIARHSAHRTVR